MKNKLDLVSIISHDIKGPLAYIQHITGHTVAHFDSLTRDELLETTLVLHDTAKELTTLLTNMLAWQKIHAHGIQVQQEEIDIPALINGEVQLQKAACHFKKITISTQAPSACKVHSDAFILRLILQNMLSNALKFSPENSSISISANCTAGFLALAVKDHGKGMHQEDVERLLAGNHNSTTGTQQEQGTGLGILLIQQLVALLKGALKIDSTPDVGTLVTVQIPVNAL